MTVYDDIRHRWMWSRQCKPLRWRQQGGGTELRTYYSNGHPIELRITHEGTTIYISGGEKAPCFELNLNIPMRTAVLETVRRRPACFADNAESRELVRTAYALAQEYSMRRMEFRDLSFIYCPQEVELANLSFLTTGQTWYESILPVKCQSCEFLEEYRERARTNTWRTVGANLIDIDTGNEVDIDASGSAMRILSAMKEDKQFCWFFAKYMGKLLVNSGIESFQGKYWSIDITSPIQRRTTSKRSNTRTHLTLRRRKT